MNQRGFVTVFALCLILVVALVVKGIADAETNHNYETAILQAEFDLQSAADGGIYEAAEKVRAARQRGQELLPTNNVPSLEARRNHQKKIPVTTSIKTLHGTIRVEVWGERLKIQDYKRLYPSYKKVERGEAHYGYYLFSVAELNNPRFGKMYRRAFAYVIDGHGIENNGTPVDQTVDDADKIYFTELPSGKGN